MNKTVGVYFDSYKQRWIGKIQKNGVVYKKGFVNRVDAINYRNDMENQLNLCPSYLKVVDIGTKKRPKNFCFEDSIFEMKYYPEFQHFSKEDVKEKTVETGAFFTKQINFRLIYKDNVTAVVLEDGTRGVAKCGKNDTFSRKAGLEYAFGRAYGAYLLKKFSK